MGPKLPQVAFLIIKFFTLPTKAPLNALSQLRFLRIYHSSLLLLRLSLGGSLRLLGLLLVLPQLLPEQLNVLRVIEGLLRLDLVGRVPDRGGGEQEGTGGEEGDYMGIS